MVLLCSYKPLVVLFASVSKVPQDAAVPFVVKYFPELPVCEGSASTVAHDVAVPLVVKNLPELPV
jgi:hypothetical protein